MISPLTGFDALLIRKFTETIAEEIASKSAEIASGIAKDMTDYGKRCGHITGLRDSLSILEETARKLMGDERPNDER